MCHRGRRIAGRAPGQVPSRDVTFGGDAELVQEAMCMGDTRGKGRRHRWGLVWTWFCAAFVMVASVMVARFQDRYLRRKKHPSRLSNLKMLNNLSALRAFVDVFVDRADRPCAMRLRGGGLGPMQALWIDRFDGIRCRVVNLAQA